MSLELKNRFDYAEVATSGTATKNTTTNLDLKITDAAAYLNGGSILYQSANWGDYIKAQVVDVDNILGYGAGFVVNTYINKRYIHPDENYDDIELPYVGNILQNLYLRIAYTSTSTTTDVKVAINYYIHHLNT